LALAGTGDVILTVLALAGQTNSATTLDLFLSTSGDGPSYGAMVERHDGTSWLRDDDGDEFLASAVMRVYGVIFMPILLAVWLQ